MEETFLTAKDKTTTSVINGLHQGIYKACTCDDTLASIQMLIVSLAFEFGLKGVSWWHGKGLVLGKRRTIKLLVFCLNFVLKWALSWRLVAFAENHEIYNKAQHALPRK